MKSSTRCESPNGWVRLMCAGHGSEIRSALRCRDCDGCRKAKQTATRRRIEGAIAADGNAALVTLTSLPGTSWAEVMRSWGGFLRWLRREGWAGSYAAVKEEGTRAGMRHLHVVVLGWKYVNQGKLSEAWERYSGARVVDVRRIDTASSDLMARYVSKYLTKALQVLDVRKVVTYGRGFPRAEYERRWVYRGSEPWYSPAPAGAYQAAGSSTLVLRVGAGCDCLPEVRELDLEDHLFLRRLLQRGPRLLRPMSESPRRGGAAPAPARSESLFNERRRRTFGQD